MRLALSTALLVIGRQPPSDTIARLIDDFCALGLPVIQIGRRAGSAFTGTGLESSLEEQGVLTLVVCGGAAEATARDALSWVSGCSRRAIPAAIAEVAAALDVLSGGGLDAAVVFGEPKRHDPHRTRQRLHLRLSGYLQPDGHASRTTASSRCAAPTRCRSPTA